MAETIEKGITIQFRGDTIDFDKGVSKINGELKDLKNETKLLNRELKLDPKNFELLSKKMDTLKEQESKLKEELDSYNQAMSQMDKNSKAFKDAETKARNLKIELGYVEKSIENLGGNKLTLGLNLLGKNLQDTGKKVTDLGKKLSGLSATASAVLGGFAKLSYDTITYADDINTLSKQTGLGTDTLQAFGQMANLIDVDLNTLSKSAVYLTKNLTNKASLEAYKKLGVAVKDNNGNYRDTETILFDTLKALQNVNDETERSLLASKLFGKSYSDLGAIINDVGVDLDKISDDVRKNGAILSQDELNRLNEANDNIDTLKMTLGGLGTSLVSEFAEPIAMVTEKVLEMSKKIKEFVGNLSTEQKQKILMILGVVATISPILLILGKTISTLGTIITGVGSVLKVIIPIVKSLWAIIQANPFEMLIVGIMALITILVYLYNNCEGFRVLVDNVALTIKNALVVAFNWLKDTISNVIDKVKDIFNWLGQLWNKFIDTEPIQTAINIFTTLKETLDSVIEALKSVFSWMGSVISKVGDFFASGINKVVGWFSSGGFGNIGAYASGGLGTLELSTTINVNNNGATLSSYQAQQFGRQIVEYVNDKLGRRI